MASRKSLTARLHLLVSLDPHCEYCGREVEIGPDDAAPHRATVDHRYPLSRGGSNLAGNLALACYACNRDKADMTLAEWAQCQAYVRKGVRRAQAMRIVRGDDPAPTSVLTAMAEAFAAAQRARRIRAEEAGRLAESLRRRPDLVERFRVPNPGPVARVIDRRALDAIHDAR